MMKEKVFIKVTRLNSEPNNLKTFVDQDFLSSGAHVQHMGAEERSRLKIL